MYLLTCPSMFFYLGRLELAFPLGFSGPLLFWLIQYLIGFVPFIGSWIYLGAGSRAGGKGWFRMLIEGNYDQTYR